MILTIAGLICVIMGCIVSVTGKRMIKKNENLRICQIKSIEETDSGYNVTVAYIPTQGAKIEEEIILMDTKPKKTNILMEMTPYGLEIYNKRIYTIILPVIFWILGLFLLMI